ncbi:MAG TPA: phosphotransferase [Mycobacteriales bacterium]|jgi:aminoglycoside phosphotransferase (APT) family kinase protein|nr:phosphotransferase [Mycobacteriales bacterium]
MRKPGEFLASGRDADIFECGPGLVLRRSRHGRSLADEARIMSFLHDQGYPVPKVEEISADGRDLVMERIDGPSMADWMSRKPWTVRRGAATLADLHDQLHAIPAPDYLWNADVGAGAHVVHMDLHPLNVIMSRQGPIVIDWARPGRGEPMLDVAVAYLLMATAAVPAGRVQAAVIAAGRSMLADAFARRYRGRDFVRCLSIAAEWKARDANMSAAESAAMRALAADAARGS